MSYRVRYTNAVREDLLRLYEFLSENDLDAARSALEAIKKSLELLQNSPFTCRKAATDSPFLREMMIPYGAGGCWFESSHPDYFLHESDLPGVALCISPPVHVWSKSHLQLTIWGFTKCSFGLFQGGVLSQAQRSEAVP